MSVIALDINATKEYFLKADRGEDPTIWLIGQLDSPLWNSILDETTKFSGESDGQNSASLQMFVHRNARDYQLLRFGLRGWRNLNDVNGNDVLFSTVSVAVPGIGNRQGLSEKLMDMIKPFAEELADEVFKANSLSKEERGN